MRYPQAMGARTAISLERYLHTTFPDVDREYRDGEIVERSLPDYLHGRVQGAISAFFFRLCAPNWRCFLAWRRVWRGFAAWNLVLIPDVAVFYPHEPDQSARYATAGSC